jgi:dihydrofolate reductase
MKVFLIAAISADGFIAKTSDQLADWTSSEDKKLFTRLTKEAGYMVMGSRTFATIGRALPDRKTIIYSNHPETIIGGDDDAIEITQESPAELVKRLAAAGIPGLAICGGAQIYSLFAEAGVIDEVYLTIEPILFGSGVPLFGKDLDIALELIETNQLNEHAILLHYRVLPKQ